MTPLLLCASLIAFALPGPAADAPDAPILRASFDGDGWGIAGPAFDHVTHPAQPAPELFIPGKSGRAVRLRDGQVITLKLHRPLPHAAGTIALWVQPAFSSEDEQERVLFMTPARDAESHDNWQMQRRPNGELLARAGKMGVCDLYLPRMRFEAGQWMHLAMAWDARNLSLYVDGKRAMAAVTRDTFAVPGDMLTLGGWPGAERCADAAFDDLLIYDRKLSAEEIAALAGGATGAALGPELPAGRRLTLPGPLPTPDADDPSLLIHLDFETWPPKIVRELRPRSGRAAMQQVEGRFGKAVEFTRGGASINVADMFPSDRGTVALWVRTNWDGDQPDSKVFFHVSSTGGGVHNYHIQAWGGGLSARAGAMNQEDRLGSDVRGDGMELWKAGEWHFIAFAWGPERARVYLDGDLAGEQSPVGYPFKPGNALSIGAWYDGNRCADAAIDEFRVYTEELSADEITMLFTDNARH